MLANDIAEMGGEAVILETAALDHRQEDKVVARFKADRDDAYREFIDKSDDFETDIAKETTAQHFTYNDLEEHDVELKKLQGWLEKIMQLDFYGCGLAPDDAELLKGC